MRSNAAFFAMVLIGCSDRTSREVEVIAPVKDGPVALEPGAIASRPRTSMSAAECHPPAETPTPEIEVFSSGGMGPGGLGNVRIFEDGTVLFDGGSCSRQGGHGYRGKVAPSRVATLLAELEKSGFLDWSCSPEVRCTDAFITSLTVRHGAASNTVVVSSCEPPGKLADAVELVRQTLGKNPCDPQCAEGHPPAFCS